MSPGIQARTGIPEENTTGITAGSLSERLDALFLRLIELRPRNLFLFHHQDDLLAVAVAQPEICHHCVFVHHSDAAFPARVAGHTGADVCAEISDFCL